MEYKKCEDGTFRKVKEIPEVLTENQLKGIRDSTAAQLAVVDSVRSLSVAEAGFVATVMSRYGDPLGKNLMTWEQAVDNMIEPMNKDVAAIDKVLTNA